MCPLVAFGCYFRGCTPKEYKGASFDSSCKCQHEPFVSSPKSPRLLDIWLWEEPGRQTVSYTATLKTGMNLLEEVCVYLYPLSQVVKGDATECCSFLYWPGHDEAQQSLCCPWEAFACLLLNLAFSFFAVFTTEQMPQTMIFKSLP